MKRTLMALVLGCGMVLGFGGSIQSASAADPAPTLEDRVKALEDTALNGPNGIQFSGFVDTYYSLNFGHPSPAGTNATTGNQPIRAFDIQADKFSLNMVELALQKSPTDQTPIGFRVDLDFGPGASIVHGLDPGGSTFNNIEQAYVTYVAPIGKGLTIDLGQFVTWVGYEVIESQDNWNYSRGILFTWAIPFYHAGLRLTLPVTDTLTVSLMGVNGWNNAVSNNAGKDLGASIAFTGIPKVSLVADGIWGSYAADGFRRDVYDFIATITPTDKLSLAANADYGTDDCLVNNGPAGAGCATPGKASWFGVAGYLRYAFTDAAAMALRAEWYKDGDGTTTGVAQTLGEITATGEYKIASALLTRLEFRRDWSNQTYFLNGGSTPNAHAQDTIELGVVYTF
jgi:Putative beta-barrel porin-2, OmpL-like. bbp2